MKWLLRSVVILMMFIATTVSAQKVDIVPKPVKCEISAEGSFPLSSKTKIVATDNELIAPAAIFAVTIAPVLDDKLMVKQGNAKKDAVNITLNKQLSQEEYTLKVTVKGIFIEGGSAAGVFHGLQSLRQLIIANKGNKVANIPLVDIDDKPHFSYRGMMLDVCRHFRTVAEVKRYIDILSMHKINKFHWHLTDDQGWRIEIKKYPLLTQLGSVRSETLVGQYGSDEYDGIPHGGYYTQDQIRHVVKYASDRYIDVIPEIEMPGHACAALTAYPELGCKGSGYAPATTWGVFDDVFCAGKDHTFDFLQGVLEEVMELFPSKYIHIGGDECPKKNWKECPQCQKRITGNNLKDEHELQSYFMKRMETWLNRHGRSIIGWDEILEGGVSPTATVMSWRGSEGGIQAAKKGNKVIMAPNSNCYFDYYQALPKDEPLAIGGFIPVETVYKLDPCAGLNDQQKGFIMGAQANLWCEYIPVMSKVEYMVLPRMAALSEVCWSYDRKDYEDFIRRMQTFRMVYDISGYNYAKHIFTSQILLL